MYTFFVTLRVYFTWVPYMYKTLSGWEESQYFRNGETKSWKLNDSSSMIQETSGPADARIFCLPNHCSSLYNPSRESDKIKLENRCSMFDNPQKDIIAGIDKQMWPFVWFYYEKNPKNKNTMILYLLFNVCNPSGFFLAL